MSNAGQQPYAHPKSAAVDQALVSGFNQALETFWQTIADNTNKRLARQACNPEQARESTLWWVSEYWEDPEYTSEEMLFGPAPRRGSPTIHLDCPITADEFESFENVYEEQCKVLWQAIADDVKRQTGEDWPAEDLMLRYNHIQKETATRFSSDAIHEIVSSTLNPSTFWQTLLEIVNEKHPQFAFTIDSLREFSVYSALSARSPLEAIEDIPRPERDLFHGASVPDRSLVGMTKEIDSDLFDLYGYHWDDVWYRMQKHVLERTGEFWRQSQLQDCYADVVNDPSAQQDSDT